ncbi:RNA polymerase sigma factor [Pedobacter sp. ok626]|uniref:RNA polymerase sigma factor n=1 Tax=Pedobacter sp. ok626 TaxID=1761882 RepID=UPI000B881393|nr:sigma-70 family RNA polymerase sigma factor [Pedobacter sp. ok626]
MKQQAKKQYITDMYNKFWKELYIVAFRRLRDEAQVEDMLQDLFLSLLEGDYNLENENAVRALLHTRLKSRIIDFFRKELLKINFENHEAGKSQADPHSSDDHLMGRELESVVMSEINRLPEKMKEIFLLSREEMLSNEEIASRLNISGKTVRNQLSTALNRIRLAVRQYGSAELRPASVTVIITIAALMLTDR